MKQPTPSLHISSVTPPIWTQLPNGTQTWTIASGRLHRLDGPARIDADGTQMWCVFGELHRSDGPAVLHASGHQEWYLRGKLHRLDGPAVLEQNGTQHWFVDELLHRLDGPAIIRADGTEEWWIDGSDNLTAHQKLAGLRKMAQIATDSSA